MRARLVVFPIKGRNWCFTRSLDAAVSASAAAPESAEASTPPPAWRDLWRQLTSGGEGRSVQEKVELSMDLVAEKMNRAWANLEKAPAGSFKNKIHGLGLKLLSRVNPSEIFLKSVSNDITKRKPSSCTSEVAAHRYEVLPLPNIPFFWLLFRAYSNWRALKGSERLLLLVSDCSSKWRSLGENKSIIGDSTRTAKTDDECPAVGLQSPWILQPSEELDKLLSTQPSEDGASNSTLSCICRRYHLNEMDVLRYKESL